MGVTPPFARRRTRLGCGLGCLTQTLLVFALTAAVMVAAQWVFASWAFFLGGHFHPIPVWQGIARTHAPSGDFVVYVWFTPSGHSRVSNLTTFTGGGTVCSPRGERFSLTLYAVVTEHHGRDTNGAPVRIEMHRRPWYSIIGTWHHRPRLKLSGRWQNPDLVMNDDGTLSQAFLPDGRLYDGPPSRQPAARESLPLVFHETPWTLVAPGCQASR